MLKLHLLSVGKTKEKWLDEAVQEYIKRLSPTMKIDCTWVKSNQELIDKLKKENAVIYLDPAGKAMDSESFSDYLFRSFEKGGSRLCMVIGGPEGLPAEIKASGNLLSLSTMTMTHQIVRLVLLEQLYRAAEIARGSPYHRGC